MWFECLHVTLVIVCDITIHVSDYFYTIVLILYYLLLIKLPVVTNDNINKLYKLVTN